MYNAKILKAITLKLEDCNDKDVGRNHNNMDRIGNSKNNNNGCDKRRHKDAGNPQRHRTLLLHYCLSEFLSWLSKCSKKANFK